MKSRKALSPLAATCITVIIALLLGGVMMILLGDRAERALTAAHCEEIAPIRIPSACYTADHIRVHMPSSPYTLYLRIEQENQISLIPLTDDERLEVPYTQVHGVVRTLALVPLIREGFHTTLCGDTVHSYTPEEC